MRIENIESFLVGGAHFVRIHTDDGLTGLGQSACWGYPAAVDEVIQAFRTYLVGSDPSRIEQHWHHLQRMGAFRGSILGAAVSAVDIALWDLKGKRFEVPVYELLGGRIRDRVRLHALMLGKFSSDELAREAGRLVDQGFTALKFEPFPPDYYDLPLSDLIPAVLERVTAVRDAVGRKADLILEMHRGLTALQAIPVLEALRPLNLLFVEDPIQIDSIATQAELARRVNICQGYGERCNTIWEFREMLSQGGPQYVRADVGQAGGISHCKKVAALAEAHHASMSWHNYLGPVLTAASVQLDACVPNVATQEYYPAADEGPAAAGFTTAVRRVGGEIVIPDAPGLGVSLNEAQAGELDLIGRPLTRVPLRKDGSVAFAV